VRPALCPQADLYLGILILAFVLSIRTVAEDGRLLDQAPEAISGAMGAIRTAASEFDSLPTELREERMRNIRSLPFAQSLQARRILEEFSQPPQLGRTSTDASMDAAITERLRSQNYGDILAGKGGYPLSSSTTRVRWFVTSLTAPLCRSRKIRRSWSHSCDSQPCDPKRRYAYSGHDDPPPQSWAELIDHHSRPSRNF
jgi:hypothetical protein